MEIAPVQPETTVTQRAVQPQEQRTETEPVPEVAPLDDDSGSVVDLLA